MDFTGTGNSLNPVHPSVLRLIMGSLRYWVTECHVDGFRFDLASTLAREFFEVDRLSAFFDTIHQDPVLSQAKLIAEPWDVGPGGYQVGNFPVLWAECNGLYRDTVRDWWREQPNVAQFASRFTGSSDLYQSDGRTPSASINFVTAHDGFTLRDLVSYNQKHNEANGEGNRDGTDDNRSWNHGVEGDTDDPRISAVRARQQRNLVATLLLSQGVPMLLGGDELADDPFLLLYNAGAEAVTFTLPTRRFGARWEVELATGEGAPEGPVAARGGRRAGAVAAPPQACLTSAARTGCSSPSSS